MEGTRPRGNSGVGTVVRFAKRLEADPQEQECAREKRRLTVRSWLVPESGGKTIATLARIREPLE